LLQIHPAITGVLLTIFQAHQLGPNLVEQRGHEAGGQVTNLDGSALDLDARKILACGHALAIVSRIARCSLRLLG
jgi:hypothetical protein